MHHFTKGAIIFLFYIELVDLVCSATIVMNWSMLIELTSKEADASSITPPPWRQERDKLES